MPTLAPYDPDQFSTKQFSTEQLDMTVNVGSPSERQETLFLEMIIGAAVFDLNGLPKEYFTTIDNTDVSWVQTIFQALGLRSLLMSSLQVDGFHYATIHGLRHRAIVVKQRTRYIALLVNKVHFDDLADSIIDWMQEFDASRLKTDPRFCLV
ncbi:MAG: hypothetical protein VKK04_23960 [Synechococcales bacterium]|nr:hypothetical protein [Synechococcales bacterium]